MTVVGLTGKACAGKNQYARAFEKYGYKTIDVDKLGHNVLELIPEKIRNAFGDEVIVNGKVDRRKLGSIVFANEVKLRLLESITHPFMVGQCREMIEKYRKEGVEIVVINAALLTRMKLEDLCDRIIFVNANIHVRYHRAKKRDDITYKKFLDRENSQKDISPSGVIHRDIMKVYNNNFAKMQIYRQVHRYCARILKEARIK